MIRTTKRVSSFMRRPGRVASGALALGLLAVPHGHAAPQELSVSQPWMRFLTPSIPAAGYFTLHNAGGHPALLIGAASPACGSLMLHESLVKNGTAHMQMANSVPVPAHGTLTFRPGGYHLMCMQPSAAIAPGKNVQVTLTFDGGHKLSVSFPVYGAKGR